VKVTKSTKFASANTYVAFMRFIMGMANYRLAKMQALMGMPLPASTQHKMMEQVYLAIKPIFELLKDRLVEATLVHTDDTRMKILAWCHGQGPPGASGENRSVADATALIADLVDGHTVVAFQTDQWTSGRLAFTYLKDRDATTECIVMADAAATNAQVDVIPGVIRVVCMDHARRKFFDLLNDHPEDIEWVLAQYAEIYGNDKHCKTEKLSHEERMRYHQAHSAGYMATLKVWMQEKQEHLAGHPNEPLGKAINYSLNNWTLLSEFLYTPGAPLSNARCEREVKKLIVHRKNSLFYRNQRGANIGSVIQSVICTCQQNNVNPIEFLNLVQRESSLVQKDPARYLPWSDYVTEKLMASR
jgi:hypothetical protein